MASFTEDGSAKILCFSRAARHDAASFSHNPIFDGTTVIVIKFNHNGVKTESQSALCLVNYHEDLITRDRLIKRSNRQLNVSLPDTVAL